MANHYKCSNGESVTEATIQRNLSRAYKEHYLFSPSGACEGCGNQANGTAHIIPKARLKQLHLTELIWNPVVWFRACHTCNTIAENPSSEDIKTLMNFKRILAVTKKYDPERATKMSF